MFITKTCAAMLSAASVAAAAQIPADLVWPSLDDRVEQIRTSPHQKLLLQEFKKKVLESMDPTCVANNPSAKDDAALEQVLDGILVDFAAEQLNKINLAFDTEKFNQVFNANVSQRERKGIASLIKDPQVSKYLALKLTPANAILADSLHEELGRVVRIWGRSAVTRSWTGYSGANNDLLKVIEGMRNDNRSDIMYSQQRTPALRKWRAIENAQAVAGQAAFDVKKTFRSNERNRELGERYASRLQQVCVPIRAPARAE
jgi:hypothetical protein